MKKFFSMMMIAAAFAFAACENSTVDGPSTDGPAAGSKLETPQLKEGEKGDTFFSIKWDAIKGAESYTLNMKGKNYTTTETTYKFENLNAGDYLVSVKASGTGYKDSSFGTITVTVTGAKSVDWFTQTVKAPAVDEENGIYPHSSVEFTWKGTDVASIDFDMYYTEGLEGVEDKDIIAAMQNSVPADILAEVNSEKGYTDAETFAGQLRGSTSYTLFAYVTNKAGVSCLIRSEYTTAEAVVADETKAWIGAWNAYTEQTVDLAATELSFVDKKSEFTLEVISDVGTTNDVLIYGFSEVGDQLPMLGPAYVDEETGLNTLIVYNEYVIEYGADPTAGEYAILWKTLCEVEDPAEGAIYAFVGGNYPTYIFTMDESGAVESYVYEGKLQDERPFTALGMDLMISFEDGMSYLAKNEEGTEGYTIFKVGAIKGMTKTESAAGAKSLAKANYSVAGKCNVPVVK